MRFLIFGQFFDRLNEGGPIFMYPLFLMMLVCIGLIIFAFVKGDEKGLLTKVTHHVSLFALVWGFLGLMIGLIGAFDAISLATRVTVQVIAGGLKIGSLSPTFGMVVFLIARLGIIGLTLKKGAA